VFEGSFEGMAAGNQKIANFRLTLIAVVATPIFLPLNEFKSNGRFRKSGYEKPATSVPSAPMDK
jgi:hypothetical protein